MTKNWKYIALMVAAFPATAALAQTGDAGRRAVDLERYEEAKSIYKGQLNQKDADNAYFALGDIYLRTGKLDSAAYYFNQGINNNKKSYINHVGLGKLALEQGNTAKAAQEFEEALKGRGKKDPYVLTMIGEAYVNAPNATEEQIKKGVSYLKQALERESKNPTANVILGDAYLKLKQGGEAMTSYDRAIQLDDNYATAYLKRGQLYTSSRNYNEAEEAFKRAIEIDPNFAPAYHDLGELYYFAGQYDKALSTFQKYVDMAEDTPETKAKYASFLFLTKNYDKALQAAEQVLQKDPNNMVMNRLRAYSYMELGQPEKALQAIETYMQKADKSKLIADDYEYYGRILAKNNQPVKAIENLEKAIQMNPEKVELYSELANTYAANNQYAKAIEAYERKRENVEPSNADYYYMGNIYMMAGEEANAASDAQKANDYFKKADETYAKVVESNPTYAPAYLWRARANASQDPETEQGLAKPYYEEFIKQAGSEPEKYKPNLIEANSYLGYYYYLKGERDNALKYWQAVKQLDPANAQAEAAITEINKSAKKK
ncbi:tetratricopeptide repeat protein [Pontibacter ummariensis]|uniref:Tetratricopeptide repeat-containing protein n=1 Tax=Pontibacter ummariensis TaxID=1610492 RepID=A0A239JH44_9BACT|nr:tetratricopeptide repeat protein [Pontibacter ummariensis]PRY07811.1 tetratricopeptide repeat protein [Pontibacter ummariensis]SNT05127.1 Tetratricopeptide repeat-containing protein [Pontibacter ummariensis]